jgi:hypothetical protein
MWRIDELVQAPPEEEGVGLLYETVDLEASPHANQAEVRIS